MGNQVLNLQNLKKIIQILLEKVKFLYENFQIEGLLIVFAILANFLAIFFLKAPLFIKIVSLIINISLFFFLVDVLKKAVEKKLKAENLSQIIFNAFNITPQGLCIYDEYFTIIQVNKKFCNIVGLSPEEIVGQKVKPEMLKSAKFRTLAQIFFPSLIGQILERKTEEKIEISFVYFKEPTDTYFVIWTVPVLEKEKNVVTKLKIVEDKTAEILYQKNQNAFYDIAAHQLKTPLSEINWILETLKNPLQENEKNELLNTASKITKKITWLVETILNSVKIESGSLNLNITRFNIAEVINDILDILEPEIKINKINLIKDLKDIEIPGDRAKIFLALSNIIDNGIRYNKPEGKLEISNFQEGDFVKIIVKDTGIGIPQKEQEELFKRFFRASNVRKIGKEGFGLGLYISKKLIDLHGGKIKIESKEGIGTNVTILLPIKEELISRI
jgi:two-component system phosphate regulon sensor histidine kinase PhoR